MSDVSCSGDCIGPPHSSVYGLDENQPLNTGQARELATAPLAAAAELDGFRCFEGSMRQLPGLTYRDSSPVLVTITSTQLPDGTIEGRSIRMSGPHWDDEIDSQTARTIARALLDAADDLDRLRQH